MTIPCSQLFKSRRKPVVSSKYIGGPDSAALPRLPKPGHWHTHKFTAAVVPAHQIVAADNQKAAADEFLKAAIDVAIKIVR
jgi:hypothetical protein